MKQAKIFEVTQIISQMYDEMTRNLETQTEKDLESIERDIGIIEGHVVEMEFIKDHADLDGAAQERLKYILDQLNQHAGSRQYTKLSCKMNAVDKKAVRALCDKMLGVTLNLNLLETLERHRFTNGLQIGGTGKKYLGRGDPGFLRGSGTA